METQSSHIWKFSRVGGVNRVNIESAQDLLHLDELDQKLWTVLSCPVQGLNIDEATLKLIDTDADGRIRVPEVLEAVKWTCSMLINPEIILQQPESIQLHHIQTNFDDGKQMLASAKQILSNLEKSSQDYISISDTADSTAIFAKTGFNGDGIITSISTDLEQLQKTIEFCISTIGFVTDRSGLAGVNEEIVNEFYTNCQEYLSWYSLAEQNKAILPFGDNTENCLQLFEVVQSKIDDYFLRCQIAEFDANAIDVLHNIVSQIESISSKDITKCIDEIAALPLAKIEPNKPLSLISGINPAWEEKMHQFYTDIVIKMFPKNTHITHSEWKNIVDIFNEYIQWKSNKKGERVEALGIETIRNILRENNKNSLLELIAQDKALENEANNIFLVDKLLRFTRDLNTLLRNFVTFHDLYAPHARAIFEVGTLFIEQRSCNLCIQVSDMAKHNTLAGYSGMFLIYCDCASKTLHKQMTIVVGLTNGDIDNVMVGRNAVFYDRDGNDWDATIIKIIENPISIRQAFWSPYRKVARFIETQANKFAASKENKVTSQVTNSIEKTTNEAESKNVMEISAPPAGTQPQPFDIGKFVGIFAAIGMAIGAIGAVLASFISGFLSLSWWKMPLAIIAIILVISFPSMFIAWLKLRKRNLAPILDANGWAINARVLINIPFGNTLTQLVKLPKNSKIDLKDPFEKTTTPVWLKITYVIVCLGIIVALLWYFGYFVKWGWI